MVPSCLRAAACEARQGKWETSATVTMACMLCQVAPRAHVPWGLRETTSVASNHQLGDDKPDGCHPVVHLKDMFPRLEERARRLASPRRRHEGRRSCKVADGARRRAN